MKTKRLILIAFLVLIGAGIALVAKKASGRVSAKPEPVTKTARFPQPKTLAELLALPPDQLEQVDLALINLLCAEGLRGAQDLDVQRTLALLDTWTAHVASETRRNQHLFDEHPERFKNSLAYFRMAMIATVLVQDLRIRYNPEREKQLENGHTLKSDADEAAFFADSKDVFIHGLLSGQHYGTCASLPFLYAAIGRRLGYPVTLATTASHFYVRYEEGNGKHLNVEATEHRAFITPSDDEYRNPWDKHLSDEEVKGMVYLQPMSNREILGKTLLTRSAVLRSMKQFDQQAEIWATAARYLPNTPEWRETILTMRMLAQSDAEQARRDALWERVARVPIPHGAGYAHFQDKKVRLHLLINNSPDHAAITQAIETFETELGAHARSFGELGDPRATPGSPTQPPFLSHTLPSGEEVRIPADFLPPFERGAIPAALAQRVMEKQLDDADAILTEFWAFYDEQAQSSVRAAIAVRQAMQAGAQQRLLQNASGGAILIAREHVPPEYWDAIPQQLALRLSGLNDEREIIEEMRTFRQQEKVRERQDQERARSTAWQQARTVLWRHEIGMPPLNHGPPPLTAPPPPYAVAQNPIPEMFREWITPDIARRLDSADIHLLQSHERNLQMLRQSDERLRQTPASGAFLPRIQIVPASALGGGAPPPNSQSLPLTPSATSPTSLPLNRPQSP